MDEKFTELLRVWLDSPTRDYNEGAMLLFRLRGNPAEYRKLSRSPESYAAYIDEQLKRFYEFRTAGVTHERVMEEVAEVETIVARAEKETQEAEQPATGEPIRTGRRDDHDTLPEDIRKCYEDNLDIWRRISDYHTKIRLMLQTSTHCQDVDIHKFVSEIVKLDKKRLANWKKYDSYKG